MREFPHSALLKQTRVGNDPSSKEAFSHLSAFGVAESYRLSTANVGDDSQTVSPQLTIADLQRRGAVTFLMQHSPASYFLQGGEQKGFEYELAEAFGRELGIRVDIVTSPPGI